MVEKRKRAGKRPAPRMVTFSGPAGGEYADWTMTARADFPANVLASLQSGQISDIVSALDRIVVDHNLPDESGEVATSMGEVDPYDGLVIMAQGIFDALDKLPNR